MSTPPKYAARDALPTRTSAAETSVDDEAPTSLDRPVFTDAMLPSLTTSHSSAAAAEEPSGFEPPDAWPAVVEWVGLFVVTLVAGTLGAVLGIWWMVR